MSFVSSLPKQKLNFLLQTFVDKNDVDRCESQIINGCLRNSGHNQVVKVFNKATCSELLRHHQANTCKT